MSMGSANVAVRSVGAAKAFPLLIGEPEFSFPSPIAPPTQRASITMRPCCKSDFFIVEMLRDRTPGASQPRGAGWHNNPRLNYCWIKVNFWPEPPVADH